MVSGEFLAGFGVFQDILAGYWHYFEQCLSVLVMSQPVHTCFRQVQLHFLLFSLVFSQFGDISDGLVIF